MRGRGAAIPACGPETRMLLESILKDLHRSFSKSRERLFSEKCDFEWEAELRLGGLRAMAREMKSGPIPGSRGLRLLAQAARRVGTLRAARGSHWKRLRREVNHALSAAERAYEAEPVRRRRRPDQSRYKRPFMAIPERCRSGY